MPKSKGIAAGLCAYCNNSTPRDEAVTCSICEEIAHRYRVGVSLMKFSTISENSPYSCEKPTSLPSVRCAIPLLRFSEIAEPCSALSDLSKKQEQLDREQAKFVTQGISGGAAQWTDVVRRRPHQSPSPEAAKSTIRLSSTAPNDQHPTRW